MERAWVLIGRYGHDVTREFFLFKGFYFQE